MLVVNGDDPQVGDLARERSNAIAYGIDDPRHARPALQHAADSRYCVRCGQPYEFAAAYVGHLGDYRCPACGHARPELQVRATEIELDGLHAASFLLETPAGSTRLRLPLPGLYNVYNALGAAALAQALGASLEEIRDGLERFGAAFGRFERIPAGDKTVLVLLIKNPAGANEVVHTLLEGGAPSLLVVALNDAIADGKDVSWIWDVDFEPLLGRTERLIASGDRAAELGVRCVYGGLPEDALDVEPRWSARWIVGSRRRRPPASSSSSPPTRRCWSCSGSWPSAVGRSRTGSAHEDPGRPPLSRVPQHLRRSRQHRGARPAGRAARPRARSDGNLRRRRGPAR